MGCQGYSGVFRGCNTLSLDWGSGTGYKAVFSQCQAVFSPSVHFCVQWSMSIKMFLVVVQAFSCVQPFATPWIAALQASLSFTISQSLL